MVQSFPTIPPTSGSLSEVRRRRSQRHQQGSFGLPSNPFIEVHFPSGPRAAWAGQCLRGRAGGPRFRTAPSHGWAVGKKGMVTTHCAVACAADFGKKFRMSRPGSPFHDWSLPGKLLHLSQPQFCYLEKETPCLLREQVDNEFLGMKCRALRT